MDPLSTARDTHERMMDDYAEGEYQIRPLAESAGCPSVAPPWVGDYDREAFERMREDG